MRPQSFEGYRAMNQGGQNLELFFYGDIGESFDGGITPAQVARDIENAGPISSIVIHISSGGGLIFAGLALLDLLRGHRAHKHVIIEGLAASAASVVAMCGDTIEASANSLFMIHNAWTYCVGNSKDLRAEADRLDKIRDAIVETYYGQCRKAASKTSRAELAAMMDKETWLSSDEAKKYGLIDRVTDSLQAAASMDLSQLSRFKYRNVPRLTQPANSSARAKVALMEMRTYETSSRVGKVA